MLLPFYRWKGNIRHYWRNIEVPYVCNKVEERAFKHRLYHVHSHYCLSIIYRLLDDLPPLKVYDITDEIPITFVEPITFYLAPFYWRDGYAYAEEEKRG